MSDFFESPPPPPDEPREQRRPEWFGPADNVLPVVVPFELVLARSDGLALAVRSVEVYPTGAVFDVPLLLREQVTSPMEFMAFRPRGAEPGEEVLRLGVQFADGSKATNLDFPFRRPNIEKEPVGPVMMPRGGGGGGRRWDVSFWLWPLPKEDPFQIVVEWPARGVELTRIDVPVAPLVAAAARCDELWPADDGDNDGGGETHLMVLGGT